MSTERFLQALQKIVRRRGVPSTIYTDNATTFHATHVELKELWQALMASKTHKYLAQQAITWTFIAPHAPWWGGFWERMVGSVKRCLRKVLGQSQLDEEGLNTILVTIEAALNSRLITQGGEESEPLIPAHFLVGDRLTTLPTGPVSPVRKDFSKEFHRLQKKVEHFWNRWKKEYLILLKNLHETHQPWPGSGRLQLGDVVLLLEDVRPRHMWRKAQIEDLHEGRDGYIRTVTLRTSKGFIISRPIQLVIPLEVDQVGEGVAG
ncbi:uncharacterized protein LOC126252152 [Schistocerca nitens]|uniref:uncharacterized protein LOC126252152 n=1 Tax=Schistocerca nitens TaxID=7011 RepID=UPI0021173F49|nr:uncharacterized protein LOC126252152 [Schistocerca nitens]